MGAELVGKAPGNAWYTDGDGAATSGPVGATRSIELEPVEPVSAAVSTIAEEEAGARAGA